MKVIYAMDDLSTLCARAGLLLASAWRRPVRLEVRERFDSGHVVLRCAVSAEGERASLPSTVILKQRALSTTPASSGFDQALLFCNEWASLDFLRAIAPDVALGPRLYASDRAQGLVLIEDLGTAPTASELLYGADPDAAAEALIASGQY